MRKLRALYTTFEAEYGSEFFRAKMDLPEETVWNRAVSRGQPLLLKVNTTASRGAGGPSGPPVRTIIQLSSATPAPLPERNGIALVSADPNRREQQGIENLQSNSYYPLLKRVNENLRVDLNLTGLRLQDRNRLPVEDKQVQAVILGYSHFKAYESLRNIIKESDLTNLIVVGPSDLEAMRRFAEDSLYEFKKALQKKAADFTPEFVKPSDADSVLDSAGGYLEQSFREILANSRDRLALARAVIQSGAPAPIQVLLGMMEEGTLGGARDGLRSDLEKLLEFLPPSADSQYRSNIQHALQSLAPQSAIGTSPRYPIQRGILALSTAGPRG